MTPRTYRRKLQKKLKHKPYIKCPECDYRMEGRLATDDRYVEGNFRDYYRIHYYCSNIRKDQWDCTYRCGYDLLKSWTGGGTADTYSRP